MWCMKVVPNVIATKFGAAQYPMNEFLWSLPNSLGLLCMLLSLNIKLSVKFNFY